MRAECSAQDLFKLDDTSLVSQSCFLHAPRPPAPLSEGAEGPSSEGPRTSHVFESGEVSLVSVGFWDVP